MVMVRALQKCFPNNMLRQIGDEFDHDGVINPEVMVALEDLNPVDKPKKQQDAAGTKARVDAERAAEAPAPPQREVQVKPAAKKSKN